MKAVLAPIPHSYNEVVRVAVSNNFNCTEAEYTQLAGLVQKYPARYFFVNSNVKTPRLLTLNDHAHKVVVTANPDLTVRESDVQRIYQLNPALIGFVRVKYIPESQPIVDLIQELSEEKIKVVVTVQRFNGKKGLDQHASREDYKFTCNRYRLHGKALSKVHALADSTPGVAICDRSGLGCQGCGMCSTLTLGERVKLSSLNLSTSGICPYNCIDCYAKTLQHFAVALGHTPIVFDKIRQNDKQSGRSEHIKHAKEALGVQ
jgi:hypothetical protein